MEAALEAFEPGLLSSSAEQPEIQIREAFSPMILLDTNICIYIINARPASVLARFKAVRMGEIGLCSVVAAELALVWQEWFSAQPPGP